MSFHSTYCSVSHRRVPCELDLEAQTRRVLCTELDATTGLCRLQTQAHGSGWLGEFLERVDQDTLQVRGARCVLLGAPASPA
jgi:hypothetical protein